MTYGVFAALWLVSAYYAYVVYAFAGFGPLLEPFRDRYSDPDLERVQSQLIAFQTDIQPYIMIAAVLLSAFLIFSRRVKLAYIALILGVAGLVLATRLIWWWLPNPVS